MADNRRLACEVELSSTSQASRRSTPGIDYVSAINIHICRSVVPGRASGYGRVPFTKKFGKFLLGIFLFWEEHVRRRPGRLKDRERHGTGNKDEKSVGAYGCLPFVRINRLGRALNNGKGFPKSANQPNEMALTICTSIFRNCVWLMRDWKLESLANGKEISAFPFRTEKEEYL